jgi:hypothetical protein
LCGPAHVYEQVSGADFDTKEGITRPRKRLRVLLLKVLHRTLLLRTNVKYVLCAGLDRSYEVSQHWPIRNRTPPAEHAPAALTIKLPICVVVPWRRLTFVARKCPCAQSRSCRNPDRLDELPHTGHVLCDYIHEVQMSRRDTSVLVADVASVRLPALDEKATGTGMPPAPGRPFLGPCFSASTKTAAVTAAAMSNRAAVWMGYLVSMTAVSKFAASSHLRRSAGTATQLKTAPMRCCPYRALTRCRTGVQALRAGARLRLPMQSERVAHQLEAMSQPASQLFAMHP